MDLDNVDLAFLIYRDNNTFLRRSKEDDFGFVLSELISDRNKKLRLADVLDQAEINSWIFFLYLLLNVLVYVDILSFRTDQHIVIYGKILDSMFELKSLSSFNCIFAEKGTLYLKA